MNRIVKLAQGTGAREDPGELAVNHHHPRHHHLHRPHPLYPQNIVEWLVGMKRPNRMATHRLTQNKLAKAVPLLHLLFPLKRHYHEPRLIVQTRATYRGPHQAFQTTKCFRETRLALQTTKCFHDLHRIFQITEFCRDLHPVPRTKKSSGICCFPLHHGCCLLLCKRCPHPLPQEEFRRMQMWSSLLLPQRCCLKKSWVNHLATGEGGPPVEGEDPLQFHPKQENQDSAAQGHQDHPLNLNPRPSRAVQDNSVHFIQRSLTS